MKVSACWIAKNEAANIGKSIESVLGAVDELIVVDTGSTDDTVKIAESYGARIEYFEWTDDFSAARNYAISCVTGDIYIFLDADEYFEPYLSMTERNKLETLFADNPRIGMVSLLITNIDKTSGNFKDSAITSRIYQNIEELRYKGKIHELIPTSPDKGSVFVDWLHVTHTGYSDNIVENKFKRNRELLSKAIIATDTGIEDKVRNLIYITRESYFLGDVEEAIEHVVEILKYPKEFRRALLFYNVSFCYNVYVMIDVSIKKRERVSRRDIYKAIFESFKAVYTTYHGTPEIDLIYQLHFDFKEDRFLREIKPAVEAAAKMGPVTVPMYKEYERRIYKAAAVAAKRRGDHMLAMEYTVSLFSVSKDRTDNDSLAMLLSVVKGQRPEEIILFLNSIFDISKPEDLDFLIRGTGIEGFRDIHAYYLKKRSEMGNAPFDDFLRLMLLYEKYDEVIENAVEAHAAGQGKAAEYIFLAALCGAPREMIYEHFHILEEYGNGEYANILESFYDQVPLWTISDDEIAILGNTYILIAFISGLKNADRYLNVFRSDPTMCYMVKAVYCNMSGQLTQLLHEDMSEIDKLNISCRKYHIQALINVGYYPIALQFIKVFLDAEIMEQELFHMLLVVVEKSDGDVQQEARRLYDSYIVIFDEMIDLTDVVNTGIVFDDTSAQIKRFFRNMKDTQFEEYIREEENHTVTGALLDLYRKAAAVYTEKGLHTEAARCLMRIVAHEAAEIEDYENLAGVFAAMKNTKLSEYIKKLY